MPPVRKKRPNAKLNNTRVHPRALEQLSGLLQSPKCAEMSRVSIKVKEKALLTVGEPDTGMIESVEIDKEFPQPSSVPHGVGESLKSPPTASKPSENTVPMAASKSTSQPTAATKSDCPLELRPIAEAEQRRDTEIAANLALYSAAISGVEGTLLPLTNGSNRQFVDSIRVYLRAAIAQYMAWVSATTPPVLPPRPANPLLRAPDARGTPTPAVPALPIKSTWATVAKNRLRQKPVPIVKAVPQLAAKTTKKDAPKARVDNRLFVRLGSDHPWRKLSPCAVRVKLQEGLQCAVGYASSLHRVRTGFAILTRNENIRERLLNAAPKLSNFSTKLNEASNLVVFRIPIVPATMKTLNSISTVDSRCILTEIYYQTGNVMAGEPTVNL
ncbi:EKA-like protein [Blumeria hordei DH14]|uniref:EKA-like protein n=1 Tax=Blumeria graminis f. sp. hordei (strain DH14) TaxID=546991 RepID=N1J8L2_BLUG1|nr:EKA-like protein [Blumeria hordei DH14]